MRERPEIARQLVTSKNMAIAGSRLQPGNTKVLGSLTQARSNLRERRIQCTFPRSGAPTPFQHGLGFPPSGFIVLAKDRACDVYSDPILCSTSKVIVLYCDTPGATVDVLVR